MASAAVTALGGPSVSTPQIAGAHAPQHPLATLALSNGGCPCVCTRHLQRTGRACSDMALASS